MSNLSSRIVQIPITLPELDENSNQNPSLSSSEMCNKENNIENSRIPLPSAEHFIPQSCPPSDVEISESTNNTMTYEQIQPNAQQTIEKAESLSSLSPNVLKIVLDNDSPIGKRASNFLINTPSSASTFSSSSISSNTRFNYDNPVLSTKPEQNSHSFQWPSQFRRQLSVNSGKPTLNSTLEVPYTPPPMLSPFRKGSGLYFRVFSQTGTSTEQLPTPTTPLGEESASPKINKGPKYQADIPQLRTEMDNDDPGLYYNDLVICQIILIIISLLFVLSTYCQLDHRKREYHKLFVISIL